MKEKTFDDLFAEELAGLASAEAHWGKALPRLAKGISTEELRGALLEQGETTKQHQAQLLGIAREFGWKGAVPACPGMEVLISECSGVPQEFAPGNLLDCALILKLQRAVQYKLAAYTSVGELARLFEREHVTAFLHEAITAVSLASKKLSQIAIQVNAEAYVDHRAPGS
ncbi:MAG: DUF892 family protein [Janthinobacterium lividum]